MKTKDFSCICKRNKDGIRSTYLMGNTRIGINDDGHLFLNELVTIIRYCPWCGKVLPERKL